MPRVSSSREPGRHDGTALHVQHRRGVEHERLRAQAQVWDRLTFRRLAECGVTEGWDCLDVGAGSGTVVQWLSGRVGDSGQVVATDLETTWLQRLKAANLEVLRHDVSVDPFGESVFDLITLRLVLVHQRDQRAVLDKLVAALKPGGTLLVEECDFGTLPMSDPPDSTWSTVAAAPAALVELLGADPHLGDRLPRMLRESGLTDVDAEAVAFPRRMPDIPSWQKNFQELRDRMIEAGLVEQAQVDEVIATFDDPSCELVVRGPTMVSVRGRKAA
ncbi:methyltransferase domain-containing protein [Saccharopolyspora rhizosphaerae]|uniref:Methyltransferase domain-containing protein n=1 Tax=Saccharopolyspora rhizosphaerae TaxID=2492662 RepID=A0A426K4X5_9PSEU|nr:methyltransferase domain-containing protein [Saccharopolyspora rhizosphaerae]RRO20459.1 methyltransferase domain-containing protein [Saccharopolyspora rhizosphaerae]